MMKRFLCLLLCVSICSSLARPVKAANEDYLNITLADIIIAWYNASGTAIGDTNFANAIYSAYGSITIDDLVENGVLITYDPIYQNPDSQVAKDYVRELIGYGNLTVPMIGVRVGRLRQYLSGYPLADKAREALEAMFYWEGNAYNEAMFGLLGMAIGTVVNIGKIGYQLAVETVTEISDEVKNSYLGKTLLDVYRHFTDTTYFQDLLEEEYTDPGAGTGPVWEYTFSSSIPAERGGFVKNDGTRAVWVGGLQKDIFAINWKPLGRTSRELHICNLSSKEIKYFRGESGVNNNVINFGFLGEAYISSNDISTDLFSTVGFDKPAGYAITVPDGYDEPGALEYCRLNNPWGPAPSVTGITKYINNAVGNILSDNYINLSPNIGSDEYMYIFDRPTYIETLNNITNNTDNGDYSNNSTVINNFNETNIQEPDRVTVRPSTAPADPDQPAQPFISPRPTQAPESYEGVIYEGGISEEITKKFPFCIPWDIKAMIDRLWTPESRAPYIHWDANFGSWGKLGEVDIDLQEFNGVAAIFRATTLLLWIVWLVTITRNLLG